MTTKFQIDFLSTENMQAARSRAAVWASSVGVAPDRALSAYIRYKTLNGDIHSQAVDNSAVVGDTTSPPKEATR